MLHVIGNVLLWQLTANQWRSRTLKRHRPKCVNQYRDDFLRVIGGAKLVADKFLQPQTLGILVLGVIAFGIALQAV
ncbi:Oxaloacetate decarboxylase beta chain [Mannheimia haemolytica]|uniref:Oxaloacetate decarboxylase beta chain n=1 Tax=Mannheimia haemolytica TaxID=75985 RepID=A0A378MXD8_MANHA|nr:Oxaloacetate decarboxylase beta chain [Mannheimia haemolytica]